MPKRADALIWAAAVDLDTVATMGRVTRSAVLRLPLLEGVKVLELKRRYRGR